MDWAQADLAIQHPRSQWARWGVTRPDGSPIAADAQPASLLLPMGRFGPAFLAYPNFQVFLEWNQSIVYSTSAAYLATRINGAPRDEARHAGRSCRSPRRRSASCSNCWRGAATTSARSTASSAQKSRAAVKAEQVKLGLPADSYPTPELVQRLQGR